MLVHSFDPSHQSLEPYAESAAGLGVTDAVTNTITTSTVRGGVTVRLGWVKEC